MTAPRCFVNLPVSLGLFLCRIDRGDKHTSDNAAFMGQSRRLIRIKQFCFLHQFKPILGFIAFFQSDLKFCNKIGSAVSIFSFTDVCSHARCRAFELVDDGVMTFYPIAKLKDFNSKIHS